MAVNTIDLNADLAEDCGDDAAMYPHLSSANIACGQHAGGSIQMRVAVRAAMRNGVSIGAHPGYPDRANFGRIEHDIDYKTLYDIVMRQLRDLQFIIDSEGGQMRYVKPHGALWHRIGKDSEQAQAVVDAVADFNPRLDMMIPDTAIVHDALARRFLRPVHEFFADRAYQADGTLAPRGMDGAVIDDTPTMVARVLEWLRTRTVTAIDGTPTDVRATSICLHGDTPGAVANAAAIHSAVTAAGYRIASWLD